MKFIGFIAFVLLVLVHNCCYCSWLRLCRFSRT